jgi:hypothetical protein
VLGLLAAGSVGYHGPGTRGGKAVHDASLGVLTATMVTSVARANDRRRAAAMVGSAAVVTHGASRTGSRACRPDSVLQLHGLWHVLSAAAITIWATGEGERCDD